MDMAETTQYEAVASPRRPEISDPSALLKSSIDKLKANGGFDLIASAIEGTQNLNPELRAGRAIFLSDTARQSDRDQLTQILSVWAEVIEQGSSVPEMIGHCLKKVGQCEEVHTRNIAKAVEASRDLERSYRNVSFFFQNADIDKVRNVSFVNCDLEHLKDLDDARFIEYISEEIKQNYDRLDLRNNYSILVLPGYLGSNTVVEKWSKIAFDNKVMLVTDFEHLDEPDDVMEIFDAANLTSGDIYKSNVMMTCNWLIGRGRYMELGEEEDLYVPPSGALAGKIYRTLMSQVTAGKKFGVLNGVDGVKFELKKSEIANLEKLGLVPMVRDYGKVMAFSAKTLFNGDNLGLQTYSVVRVFDYVTKVMIDYLNRRAFENFNSNTRKDLMNQIVKFLDSITGPDKLIEDFTIRRFEQDPVQKDRIHLDIHMKPYFPAKNFLIKLEGQKGDEGNEWASNYDQQ
jgi:hypothetical protein